MSRGPAPSHVLMTADAVGGVWTYAADLASGLAKSSVAVTLAVLGPSPSEQQRRMAAGLGVQIIDTGLSLDWLEDDPRALDRSGRELARMAGRIGADLIHLNSPALAAGAGFGAPVIGACHSCLATWWDAVRGGNMPESFRWRTERLAEGYRACDALIAPSVAFAAATARRYGVTPVVVHNGRSAGSRRSDQPKDPFALTAGRLWDHGKNAAALDAAATLMRRPVLAAGPAVGPGRDTAALNHLVLLGNLDADALSEQLNRAAVFVSLARYEPFGLTVLEAAQADCALVLSDIPTFRELWDGAAVFVSTDNPTKVSGTLDRLLDDQAECARLGALAAERARRFTAETMVERTLAVYRDALSDAAPAREAAA